jgi:hypothetical protein
MQRPRCRADNSEGRRFCAECGAWLGQACPACGFANESYVRFFGGCGRPLSSTRPVPDRLQPDSPTSHPPPEAERHQLTVVFCDLVGSTALSERLDPEELRAIVRAHQEAAAQVIARFDGHVEARDLVSAVFGWFTEGLDTPDLKKAKALLDEPA